MFRRLLSAAAAAAVAFSALPPLPANAEGEEKYELYVNGSQFTADNLSIACGEGTAVFDGTDTLTLTNATLNKPSSSPEGSWLYGIINSGIKDLKIVLEGENVIDVTGNDFDGIDSAGGCSVTITGSGSLEMKEPYYGTYIGVYDIPGGDLTVKDGAKLTVTDPTAAGIWVNHDITFNGCTAEIVKSGESTYNAIVSNVGGTVTFTDSDVTVSSWCAALHLGNGDDSRHAIVVNSGTVTLESRSPADADDARKGVAITCEPEAESREINCTLTVNGGTLSVKAQDRCVNFSEDNIVLGEKVSYTEGTSLTEGGSITVGTEEPAYVNGDVNHDGEVDRIDANLLSRYVAGWDGYESRIFKDCADLNGDGNVDRIDANILSRCVADWDGYRAKYIK